MGSRCFAGRVGVVRAGVFVTVAVCRPCSAQPKPAQSAAPQPTASEPAAPASPRPDGVRQPAAHASSWRLPKLKPVFASIGYIGSFLDGDSPAHAQGVETSLIGYLEPSATADFGLGIGAVFQYQHYDEPEGHGRWAAGFELAYAFGGLELLYAHRNGAGDLETTHGLAIGPYVSVLGVFNFAARFVVPISPTGDAGYGSEHGITLGVKVPLPIGARRWNTSFGRPCTVGGRALSAALVIHHSPEPAPMSAIGAALALCFEGLCAEDRARLTRFWSEIAEEEHASIAAFHRLSLALLALGAPASLLTATALAAGDEVRHAELARAVAEQLAACRFTFTRFPAGLAANVEQTPVELALGSLEQGCLGEGTAARILAQAGRECECPELARALSFVAAEERAHAELAWQILEYALRIDPDQVRLALETWLARAAPGTLTLRGWFLPRGWGAIDPEDEQAHGCAVWSETALRLSRVLANSTALSAGSSRLSLFQPAL
jgi:hypothetical protein